jgi:hypothetical protein
MRPWRRGTLLWVCYFHIFVVRGGHVSDNQHLTALTRRGAMGSSAASRAWATRWQRFQAPRFGGLPTAFGCIRLLGGRRMPLCLPLKPTHVHFSAGELNGGGSFVPITVENRLVRQPRHMGWRRTTITARPVRTADRTPAHGPVPLPRRGPGGCCRRGRRWPRRLIGNCRAPFESATAR